ncbi:glycosyltransferase [Pseudorhodobacter antarcticus]|uniref:glycosyltransferase n=1 Tax=Pseudorhodobacter antarcticus TaxID=1077947 RepID=UPI0011137124|nr:glycosyltransferase [Pseudorhodobacter antarcticus]
MDRTVICMKWGKLYGPDYVNVLFNATRANLPGEFRFVCLTDDAEGIDGGVECLPIPDMGLREDLWRIGAWPKISLFSKDLHGLRGRALFIDLDMVIWGNLAEFFTRGTGLIAVDEGRWSGNAPSTMSSIMAFDLGRLDYLVDRLREDCGGVAQRHGLEQRYIHEMVDDIGYWPESWLVSFKRHLRRPVLIDRFLQPKQPAPGTKIVIFHGRPRPFDLIRPGGDNRGVWPHHIPGSVDWMRDYWTRNGGTLSV